jgi:hypothetical protein
MLKDCTNLDMGKRWWGHKAQIHQLADLETKILNLGLQYLPPLSTVNQV